MQNAFKKFKKNTDIKLLKPEQRIEDVIAHNIPVIMRDCMAWTLNTGCVTFFICHFTAQ